MRLPLTAVVLLKNNLETVADSLNSLDFCKEIMVIVDKDANEESLNIASKLATRIIKKDLNGDFAAQRNFAMEQSRHEWILYVDADELVPKQLAQEIKNIDFSKAEAFYIKRQDIFWGRKLSYGELYKAAHRGIIRLVKKGSGYWLGRVHERWETNGNVSTLNNHLEHKAHKNIASFVRKINFYSDLRATELITQNKNFSLVEAICLPIGKFIYTYFVLFGFLDGPAGFVYSFMMSFHSFLVRAKLFQKTILLK